MVQASIEDPITGPSISPTATTILRNDDALSQALRSDELLGLDDIARLHRALSPAGDGSSSVGTTSAPVFSSHRDSTVTKPTSTSTPPHNATIGDNGKGKAPSNASSLSVAYGSGSEAEAQQRTVRRHALLAMGDWADCERVTTGPLKGAARAKERSQSDRRPKEKKPGISISPHNSLTRNLIECVPQSQVIAKPGRNGSDKPNLRRRTVENDEDPLRLAEEGQVQSAFTAEPRSKQLQPIRTYVFIGIIASIILTIGLSAFGAYQTGKARKPCTRGIVFAATTITAFLTVLAMITARRPPQEALLAGLLVLITGFTLLVELNDFL